MRSFRSVVFVALTFGVPALAQSATPAVGQSQQELSSISCPAGTKAVGGARTAMETRGCLKAIVEGGRVFHGPFVAFRQGGTVESKGQFEDGFRHGRWTFYDAQGRKTGETTFSRGVYHGERIQYFADGRIQARENWVNGKREGLQESFDVDGTRRALEYRNDSPVMAAR